MVIKLLIFGDSSVGKSTLAHFEVPKVNASNDFSTVNISTKTLLTDIGDEIKFSVWEINSNIENKLLIDTNAFVGVHALIFIFDVTNMHSLNYVRKIHSKVFNLLNNKNIPIILVGNKTDLRNEFEIGAMHVGYEQGIDTANEMSVKDVVFIRIPYFETTNTDLSSYKAVFDFITTKLLAMFT